MDGERIDHDAFWPMKQYKRVSYEEWEGVKKEIQQIKKRLDALEGKKREKTK